MSHLSVGFYIVVGQYFKDRSGGTYPEGKPAVRVAKTKPDCKAHELAVWVQLDLPYALFVRPQLRARITVPAGQAPAVITPELQDNITQVLQDQLGIHMTISAPEAPEGNE